MFIIQDRFGNPLPTVTTTDATQTTVDSLTMDDGTCCRIRIIVVATESGGGNRGVSEQLVLVYRDGGGAVIEGTPTIVFEEFSDGAWEVDITVSGNDVRTSVTGAAATDITWKCAMESLAQ